MVCTADAAVIDASTNRIERVNSMEEVHECATRCRRAAKGKVMRTSKDWKRKRRVGGVGDAGKVFFWT